MSRRPTLPGHSPATRLAQTKHEYQEAAIAYVDAMLDGADADALTAARDRCSEARAAYKNASENYRQSLSSSRW